MPLAAIYSELKLNFNLIGEAQRQRLGYAASPTQWETAPSSRDYTVKVATSPSGLERNRYADILPFDYNRTSLGHSPFGEPLLSLYPHQEYINASYLDPFRDFDTIPTPYIACQGPLPTTISDFWTLVWNQDVQVIVNLTKEEEGGRIKCARYWPSLETPFHSWSHPSLSMRLDLSFVSEVLVLNDTTVLRQFSLTVTMDTRISTRTVYMLHFLEWPDHSGSNPQHVLELIDHAHSLQDRHRGSMIVHCSAGVGRTCTFVTIAAVLSLLQQPGLDPELDLVKTIVHRLREQRMTSVQSLEQFALAYEAVLVHLQKVTV